MRRGCGVWSSSHPHSNRRAREGATREDSAEPRATLVGPEAPSVPGPCLDSLHWKPMNSLLALVSFLLRMSENKIPAGTG